MNAFLKVGSFALLAGLAVACAKENAVTNCPPNESVSCACPGTTLPGAQVCLPDGSGYGACDCSPSGTGGAGVGVGVGVGVSSGSSPTGQQASASTGFPSSTSSFAGAGGADPNQGICDTGADCATCQNSKCAGDLCKNELAACELNPNCKSLYDCTKACDAMDAPCFNDCIGKFQNGTSDLIAFFVCTACSPGPCFNDCQGTLQCSMMQ